MPRIIALTGATGFIGSALAHRLPAEQWQIRALVRPTSNRSRLSGIPVQWIEGDLDDIESLRRLVQKTYAVVHCAGIVRSESSTRFIRINSDGVGRLVQAATEQPSAPRFLLVSSLAAREPHLSPYAASKKQGEEALAAGAGLMKWTALRPPAVYGPGDKELLPLFQWMYRGIAPILGPDDARFSLLYVEDLAHAMEKLLENGNPQQHVFELHDGQPDGYSWMDLTHTMARLRGRHIYHLAVPVRLLKLLAGLNTAVARLAGYAPMLTSGKVRELRHSNWVCDNTLLSRETGWMPRIRLEEGLRRTLELDVSCSHGPDDNTPG